MKSLLIVCLIIALSKTAGAEDFRCKNGIVSEGASKEEVLSKCGEPTTKERFRVDYGRRGNFMMVDECTYNQGPTAFIYYLRFEVGSLVLIKNTGQTGY